MKVKIRVTDGTNIEDRVVETNSMYLVPTVVTLSWRFRYNLDPKRLLDLDMAVIGVE